MQPEPSREFRFGSQKPILPQLHAALALVHRFEITLGLEIRAVLDPVVVVVVRASALGVGGTGAVISIEPFASSKFVSSRLSRAPASSGASSVIEGLSLARLARSRASLARVSRARSLRTSCAFSTGDECRPTERARGSSSSRRRASPRTIASIASVGVARAGRARTRDGGEDAIVIIIECFLDGVTSRVFLVRVDARRQVGREDERFYDCEEELREEEEEEEDGNEDGDDARETLTHVAAMEYESRGGSYVSSARARGALAAMALSSLVVDGWI